MPDALLSCSSFRCAGNTVKVKHSCPDKWDEDAESFLLGEADVGQQTVRLFRANTEMTEYRQAQTLLHEVIHIVLNYTGNYDIYDNEKLVDQIASAMLEFLTTMR